MIIIKFIFITIELNLDWMIGIWWKTKEYQNVQNEKETIYKKVI